jgi:peptide maturation system protein (TIGR04066 family)
MRTLVYPYDEDFEAVIKYGDFIETMEIREILSPVGWGLQNKKVGENIPIKTNINAVNWERIDALLLIDTIRTNLHINEILEVVKLSAKFVQKIILNRDIDEKSYACIEDICSNEKVALIDVRRQTQLRVSDNKQLKSIYTPVIVVAGMGECCNKLEVQMFIKRYLNKLDYNVCVVSSRKNMEIVGLHSFPTFIYGNQIDESEKIIGFNHYIKELEIEENPDIILIGIPGSIMPISEKHSEFFGVFAFEVFNAIKSDMLLFCIHNNIYTNEYFEELKKLCKYRYQADIDAIIISNHSYDSLSLQTEGTIKYLSFDDEEVDRYRASYPDDVYSRAMYEKLAEHVIETLSEYADFQVM